MVRVHRDDIDRSSENARLQLIERLKRYSPLDLEEQGAKERILTLVENNPDAANKHAYPAHLTASAWVIDRERTSVLLIHHKKLRMWIQPGGHADGSFALCSEAAREVLEETGLIVTPLIEEIFDVDIHQIPAWHDTPSHQHYDVRFLFQPTHGSELRSNEEVVDARWIPLDELQSYTQEESVLRMARKIRAIVQIETPEV